MHQAAGIPAWLRALRETVDSSELDRRTGKQVIKTRQLKNARMIDLGYADD
jgi:hypothetical protein